MSARRASALLAASALAATGLAVSAAAPAFAKSSIGLHAGARSVVPGERVQLTASGATDDFGGAPVRLCVEERTRGSWHIVSCGHEGTVRADVRAGRAGVLAFRAQLLAANAHGHLVVDRTSQVVTVHVG
ncbi:hypothetical protein [Streptacidiphilus jiangxiensis]|uniref:Secreted protein n=1 Tax=Streptacidiphilus jiangxiensis TaxID=235985 RepID=A0A1H7PYG6_STRJI|nr:hypothetical protein [Streptacidiphilus jiangxiensis]SEL40528.1 hypothetical protein SAMN05414137_108179 [Streptacidiphilus jiangxiensis]